MRVRVRVRVRVRIRVGVRVRVRVRVRVTRGTAPRSSINTMSSEASGSAGA